MARFDFIDSAARGYRFFWDQREVIARMALIPVVIKIVSFLAVTALGLEDNFLRLGLLLLPSYFAEGWLVAQLVRLAVLDESWLMNLSGDVKKDAVLMRSRMRGILAGTLVYVLTKLVLSVFSGIALMQPGLHGSQATATEQGPGMLLAAILLLAVMIWAFRLLWFYIPAALDYSLTDFAKRIKSYGMSFYMLGTWLMCFVPLAMALIFISQVMMTIFPADGEAPSVLYTYAMAIVQAVIEMVIAIVSSVAMTYGIDSLYKNR